MQAPPVVVPPVACAAGNATITFVNKWSLDVVVKAGDPVTHVVYTPTPAGTTFAGVSRFAVGELVDYAGTLDSVGMCHALTMTVKPAPGPLLIVPAALPAATVGVLYSVAVSVNGGLAPTAITGVAGLPPGLAWNGSAVTGTPATAGTHSLTVTAADARGLTVAATSSLVVQPAARYTITDDGKGKITAFGDHSIVVGARKILWNAATRYTLNRATQIKVGMIAQWKGKRDPVSGVVLASVLDIN